MRFALAVLATLALAATVPSASADPDPVDVQCDIDDDLYQHCNAGPVHTVYGPMCAGVAVGEPAKCHDVRRLLEQSLP